MKEDTQVRSPLPLSPLSSSPEQREGDQTILTTPCPFCPPPHFDFLMWGNPNCEVRWFPTSARSSRRWHSGCLSGFHTQPSSHFFRILQISFSLPAPSFPSLSHTDSLSFFPFFFPSHFFFLADFKRQKKKTPVSTATFLSRHRRTCEDASFVKFQVTFARLEISH